MPTRFGMSRNNYYNMKQYRFFLPIITLGLFMVSCKRENKYIESINMPVDTISVILKHKIEEYPFSSKFALSKILPLEATSDCRISDVYRVFPVGNCYIIWDKEAESVFAFNTDGKYLGKIGNRGHSDKEYIRLKDVTVCGDTIFLLDNGGHKILSYNPDGTFIQNNQIKEWAMGFAIDNNQIWLESNGQNKESKLLLQTDKSSGKILHSYFDMLNDGRLPIREEKTFSYSNDNSILFSSPYLQYIYIIAKGELQPIYKISFPEGSIYDYDITSDKYVSQVLGNNYIGDIHDVFKIGAHLFFSFYCYDGDIIECYNVYYNSETKQTDIFDYTMLHDNRLPVSPIPVIKGITNDEIIFSIDPSILPESMFDEIQKNKIFENCTNESNPILVFYKVN